MHCARAGQVGKCADKMDLASPSELPLVSERILNSTGAPAPVVEINLDASAGELKAAVDHQLTVKYQDSELVFLSVTTGSAIRSQYADEKLLRATVHRLHKGLTGAMHSFQRVCPELTDRNKRRKRECTNVC